MGYDISNHAVDVAFVRDRLVPAVMGHGNVDDFLDRAARRAVVGHRANQWGLRVVGIDHAISRLQHELADHDAVDASPPPSVAAAPAPSWWQSIKQAVGGAKAAVPVPTPAPRDRFRAVSGLPGFDSDLSVWGRPFFVVDDGVDAALAVVERYMACSPDDLGAVDAVAREQIARLEARRGRVRRGVDADILAVLDAFYPLAPHVDKPADDEQPLPSVEGLRRHLGQRLDLFQTVWRERESDEEPLDHPMLNDPASGCELVNSLPMSLIGMAAQALPGWMGRGYVWPTALFEKIGVSVDGIFQKPTALFEPLLREMPEVEEALAESIPSNYAIGGYVAPEHVPALEALLLKHRRDLILAWQEDKSAGDAMVDEMSGDFTKILEPVVWARRQGFGFIEAAEVYSGFMGVMN
jgi:hypothetical protein